jgi:hypothetical protein
VEGNGTRISADSQLELMQSQIEGLELDDN